MPEQIEAKYLKGLKFRSSTGKPVTEDGREIMKYMPFERAMRADDVLDWRDAGNEIILVSTDGQKVAVPKDKGGRDEK